MSDTEVWKFDQFEFQPAVWRLFRAGELTDAHLRAQQVLKVLLENPRTPVKRETLYERVWGTTLMEAPLLNQQIYNLRTLGMPFLKTATRVGYVLDADVHRIRGGAAQPRSVPPAPVPMIGRETEALDLCKLLQDCPVVCIQGSCGAGKTLLARHVAERRQAEHVHGLRWFDLSPVESVEVLIDLINSGTRPVALPDGAAGHDEHTAAGLDLLVVLDNADRWASHLPSVLAQLCSKSPRLRVLITSQVQTGSPLEQVFHLSRLSLPGIGASAADAGKHGAVAMFMARALVGDAAFRLTEGNVAHVVSICQSLEGLPLALNLAAARVHAIGVAALDDELKDLSKRFAQVRVVGQAPAETPQRQIGLEAAVDWSHGLLDSAHQKVFRHLAVFARAATLPLLEAVVPDPAELAEGASTTLDTLQQLVERGLATRVDAGHGNATSFRLLEAPKAFALKRLKAAGEEAQLRLRHAQALARLSQDSWSQPDDGAVPFDDWQMQAMVLLDEVAAAFEWARKAGAWNLMLQLGAFQLRAQPRSVHSLRQAVALACTDVLRQRMVPALLGHRIHLELAKFWMRDNPKNAQDHARKSLDFAQSEEFKNHADVDAALWAPYQSRVLDCVAAAKRGDVEGAAQALAELQDGKPGGWLHPSRAVWGLQALAAVEAARRDWPRAVEALTDRVRLARSAGNRGQREYAELIEAMVLAGGKNDALPPDPSSATSPVDNAATKSSIRIAECAALLNAGLCEQALPAIAEGFSKVSQEWSQLDRLAWADMLAHLKVLDGCASEAARILGYTQAGYRAFGQKRSGVVAEAYARARMLTLAALGDAEYLRLDRFGALMSDQQIKDMIARREPPSA